MRTNVSETSIHNYHNEIRGKKENSQDQIILKAIEKLGPSTCRMIQKETGLEINVVSRSINNLWSGKNGRNVKIKSFGNSCCPITGRLAKVYSLIEDEKKFVNKLQIVRKKDTNNL